MYAVPEGRRNTRQYSRRGKPEQFGSHTSPASSSGKPSRAPSFGATQFPVGFNGATTGGSGGCSVGCPVGNPVGDASGEPVGDPPGDRWPVVFVEPLHPAT